MSENDNIQKYIQQFIQENRRVYTREAITDKLVEAGYSANDIDDAYEALGIGWDVEDKPKNDPDNWRSARVDTRGFLLMFPGIPLITYILMLLSYRLAPYFMLAGVAATFAARIIVPNRMRQNPGFVKGIVYGFRTLIILYVVLPIVAGVVLFGICIFLYSSQSSF
jgi:hypothetical protein